MSDANALSLDDALHNVVTTARPKTAEDVQTFFAAISALIHAAGNNIDSWKLVTLALIRRRFHAKAPAAVEAAAAAAAAATEDEGSGDGERLLFYLALRAIHQAALEGHPQASIAATVLARLAPLAGGTRDVCALVEHLTSGAVNAARASGTLEPLGDRVTPALIAALSEFLLSVNPGDSPTALGQQYAPLAALLGTAAELLDADLQLVRHDAAEEQAATDKKAGKRKADAAADGAVAAASAAPDRHALISTISTFLPHNDRGPHGSQRRLVQGLAELLIWSRTTSAPAIEGFKQALAALSAANAGGDADAAERLVRKLQTIIRKLRQELSVSARAQGFALCSLYALDPASITLSMVRRGKAGDLHALQRLAQRAGDTRVLSLLARRAESGKAVPYESLPHMIGGWKDMQAQGVEMDELAKLDRALQRAAVLATIEQLRRRLPTLSAEAARRAVTIACLDGGAANQAAAVLVAAAHHAAGWLANAPDVDDVAEAQAAMEAHTAAEAVLHGAAAAAAESAGTSAPVKKEDEDAAAAAAPVAPAKRKLEDAIAEGAASSAVGGGGGGIGPGGTSGDDNGGDDNGDDVPPTEPAKPRLLLGEVEADVSSLPKVLAFLDAIIRRSRDPTMNTVATPPEAPATGKAVQNLIERHVGPGDTLLLFTSSDVKLEARVLAQLQSQRSTIHAHVHDDTMARLEREGARVGDVTISLSWDDFNDLDLYVTAPCGETISYRQRSSADGGMLDVDMNAGGANSREPVENVFFGDAEAGIEGPRGRYVVSVNNYAYHERNGDGKPVPFKVIVRKNGETTEFRGQCVGTGEDSRVTVCEFEYTGRIARPVDTAPSALAAANLVAVTASVGSTLDALRGLMSVGAEIAEIERTRALVADDDDADEPMAASNAPADADGGATDDDMADTLYVGDDVTVSSHAPDIAGGSQPVVASRGRFEVTSRDRLFVQLAKLPPRFHAEVAQAFGGQSLLELSAAEIAKRLLEAKLPVRQLKDAGYPPQLVEMVKRLMATHLASSTKE